MNLGAHVSISGGIHNAIDRGQELGCEAIQIFTGSPQSWNFDLPSKENLDLFKKKWEASSIKDIVAHSIYLTNLASPNPYIRNNTINSILSGLEVSKRLGILGIITHVGSHKGRGLEEGTERAIEAISNILKVFKGKEKLILEISSGAGDLLGRNFKELKPLFDAIQDERLGLCVDTAHAFESGYDIRTKEGVDKMISEIDNYIGLNKLMVLHLNDSKTPLGSNIDRHEDIGKGEIGLNSFKYLINHPSFSNLPGILETPGLKEIKKDKENLELIKSLRNGTS